MTPNRDKELSRVALLQLDVVDSSMVLTKSADSGKQVLDVLRRYISDRIRHLYSGTELNWPGDGGLFVFKQLTESTPPASRAIHAAIEIKRSMALFNNLLSPHPCHIDLRISLDYQDIELKEDAGDINSPRYSWFIKQERKIATSHAIFLTEELYSHITKYQQYCVRSHTVPTRTPAGNKAQVQIFYFNDEKSLGSERLFDILHQINKSDQSLYPYLEHHIPQIMTTLKSLSERRRYRDVLALREYLHRFFELTGKYHEGIEAGHLFLNAAEELGDSLSQCWIALKDIGWLSLQLGVNIEASRDEFKRILGEFERLKCWEGVFYCNRYLGVSYYWDKRFAESLEYLKTAKRYIAKCNQEIRPRLASRLDNNFGQYYLLSGHAPRALPFLKRSLKSFQRIRDTEKIAIVEINLARAFSMRGDVQRSSALLDDAVNHAWEISWREGVGRAKYELAQLSLADKSKATDSERHIREAFSIFKNIGVTKWMAKAETLAAAIKSSLHSRRPLAASGHTRRPNKRVQHIVSPRRAHER